MAVKIDKISQDKFDYLTAPLELDLQALFRLIGEDLLKMDFKDKNVAQINEMINSLFQE